MAEQTLAQKFQIKPGNTLLVLNAPDGFGTPLGAADTSVLTDTQYDFVLAFVQRKDDIDTLAPHAIAAVKKGGMLWFAYPKQSGAIKTDINRDSGWDTVAKAGWDGVRQISIDETWSALRYRPTSEINYTPGSTRRPKAD
jgi:hypothetical protein